MRRIGLLTALVATVLTLGVPTARANQPAFRFTEDVTGDVIACEDTTYTTVSGELAIVIHEGSSASGNVNITGTVSALNVVVADEEGNLYAVWGAFWFGFTLNANTGGEQFTVTGKIQIVSSDGGGTADSVNITFHVTAQPNNFLLKDFDFGTCAEPE